MSVILDVQAHFCWKLVAFSVVLKAVTHLVSMSCSFLYIAATRNDIVNAQDEVLGYSMYKAMMRYHSEFPNLANVNVFWLQILGKCRDVT